MADSERPSLSLRISITDRCELRCRYCMPEEGVELCSHDKILSYENIVYFVRSIQEAYYLDKVRITGGDPLGRRNLEGLIKMLSDLSVPDLALTTNGQLLEQMVPALRSAGLNRVNISLDTLSPENFHYLTRGGNLDKTLAGIRAAVKSGLAPVKINMVVIRGINDSEVVDMLEFALENSLHLRYLEMMPIGMAAEGFEEMVVSSQETRDVLSTRFSLIPLSMKAGETSSVYKVKGQSGEDGTVGFISPYTEPFCMGCRRLRLTSDGHIVGCLSRGEKVLIRELLKEESTRNRDELMDAVREVLLSKKQVPEFMRERSMSDIGG